MRKIKQSKLINVSEKLLKLAPATAGIPSLVLAGEPKLPKKIKIK